VGPDCSVEVGAVGDVLVLRVAGDIDLLTLPVVEDALSEAWRGPWPHVVVDLTDVGFCCVRGFALLVAATHDAAALGVEFAVSGVHPRFDRFTALLWPDHPITRHR
jgi:anti-anti-sigma factor